LLAHNGHHHHGDQFHSARYLANRRPRASPMPSTLRYPPSLPGLPIPCCDLAGTSSRDADGVLHRLDVGDVHLPPPNGLPSSLRDTARDFLNPYCGDRSRRIFLHGHPDAARWRLGEPVSVNLGLQQCSSHRHQFWLCCSCACNLDDDLGYHKSVAAKLVRICHQPSDLCFELWSFCRIPLPDHLLLAHVLPTRILISTANSWVLAPKSTLFQ